MRIALAVLNGRISPVLDASRQALIYDSGAGPTRLLARTVLAPDRAHESARILAGAGVRMLVCGAISTVVADVFLAHGLAVIPFVAGSVDAVLVAHAAGELPNVGLLMPGCSLEQARARRSGKRRRPNPSRRRGSRKADGRHLEREDEG